MTDEQYAEKAENLHRALSSGAIGYHQFLNMFDRLDRLARKQMRKERTK